MPLTRTSLNLVFALVVAALGFTAAHAIYRNSAGSRVKSPIAESASLPENHPPVDVSARIESLQQLSAREPQNPDYPAQIGNLYYDAGQYAAAVGYYRKSLELRPRDPNVETDLATCYYYLQQPDKSLEILDKVLSYAPGFSQAKFNKGIVLIEGKKDVKGGIAVWKELLRSDPGYSQRAEIEHRIDHLEEALQ